MMRDPLIVDGGGVIAGSNPGFIEHAHQQARDGGHDGLIMTRVSESGWLGTNYSVFDCDSICQVSEERMR
jgi:hypothetical protein